jgi:outer membrane lipoprotein-sorting protein
MKKRAIYLLLAVIALTVFVSCSGVSLGNVGKELDDSIANISDADNKYVQMVKNGHREGNTGLSYDNAFSEFRWRHTPDIKNSSVYTDYRNEWGSEDYVGIQNFALNEGYDLYISFMQ